MIRRLAGALLAPFVLFAATALAIVAVVAAVVAFACWVTFEALGDWDGRRRT